jgi:hypothetical protein
LHFIKLANPLARAGRLLENIQFAVQKWITSGYNQRVQPATHKTKLPKEYEFCLYSQPAREGAMCWVTMILLTQTTPCKANPPDKMHSPTTQPAAGQCWKVVSVIMCRRMCADNGGEFPYADAKMPNIAAKMWSSLLKKKNFEPIIQVLDFMNKLLSSKFQVPGPGALVGERGT